ncbi:TetR/AcrR family transcriptional regulator C-terminal domain-containing protein [Bacillus sp. ISL-18]|uniref:TetR/AcrR family transcriptional regulator n=1 Tax=Bacillus sp. ISL-18 TaxID=2819118 RepID=UPI001BEA0ADD|nr:TetR/AcrR family transcriptional regulator C-terminal domain-containing protein [Bacillus sp. ISL-18]MBT2655953.1 TetR/AcrR family transcriptional regulator C-terminal domain-containing protein [Bacillus sp. ISL-18]
MTKKLLKSHKDLMNSLLKMMSQKDYSTITVSQLCHDAGYNRGTFYQNYSSKDDLLNDVIDTKIIEMFTVLKPKLRFTQPSRQQPSEDLSLHNLFEFIKQNYFFFKTMIEDRHIIGFRSKIFLHYQQYLEDLLRNPIDNPDKDPGIDKFYYVYVSSASLGIMMYWLNQGLKQSIDYLIQQFLSIVYKRPHELIYGDLPFKHFKSKTQKESDPRILRTKKALSNSFIQLMKVLKYSDIKVTDILEHAQYNRSTFYSHYKSKDDLFFDAVSDFVDGMVQSLRQTNDDHSMDPTMTQSPLIHLFTFIYENSTILEVIGENNKVPGFYNKIYSGLVAFFYEELDGRFDYDIGIYSNYLASTLLGVISLWISEELRYSPRYMAKLFKLSLNNPPTRRTNKTLVF